MMAKVSSNVTKQHYDKETNTCTHSCEGKNSLVDCLYDKKQCSRSSQWE